MGKNVMQKFVSQIRDNTFLRHNAIFFVGSLFVGALNYLYYPVLGRMLEPAAFGEVQALVSLFLQLSIFLTVLGMVTVVIVTNYKDQDSRNQVIFELEKSALAVALILFLATVVLQKQLQHFFQFQDTAPFIMLAVALVVTVPFTFRSSFLRGKKYFGLASWANILGAGGKLLLSVLLVTVGLGTAGAIGGIVAAQVIAAVFAGYYALRHGLHIPGDFGRFALPRLHKIAGELRYTGWVLATSLTVMVLLSIDIVVVKHYFDAHTAGLYAGIATVARILFFLTASIGQVLLSSVSLEAGAQKNAQLLRKSLILFAVVGGSALLVCVALPETVIKLLMGSEYSAFAELLPKLSATVFIVSLINMLVTYFIALHHFTVGKIVIIGAVVPLGLLIHHHSSPAEVVNSLFFGNLFLLLGLSVFWVKAAMPIRRE